MKNAGWLFYRNYYEFLHDNNNATLLSNYVEKGKLSNDAKEAFFKEESKDLIDFKWESGTNELFQNGKLGFYASTTYPGLVIGSGYGHQTGTTGEFKSGFFFDHTTGLPLIPGSSVKGLLRSAFPENEKREKVKAQKVKFIQELLATINPSLKPIDVCALEKQIFEGKEGDNYLPSYQHDVFFDAYIAEAFTEKKKIFGDDYITPHKSPLKSPIPVRFLKLLPGVVFQFQFDLKDAVVKDIKISAKEKSQLFEKIIHILGIGTKTNVGYGQLTKRN